MQTLAPHEIISKKTIYSAEKRRQLVNSFYSVADKFYEFSPWKYIPGAVTKLRCYVT